jgi:UDP-N-acetylmuramoyl-tripeptide--D-alanyl-D-alanine ligase
MVGLRAAQVAKILLTLGPRARVIAESARRAGFKPANIFEFDEQAPIVEWLKNNLASNDAVLIKGSHGLRMDRITAALEVKS